MSEIAAALDIDIDIEGILKDAAKSGKITKQQRAAWIRQVIDAKEKVLSIRQLAEIIGCSYNKVQKDWRRGLIPDAVKKGKAGSRCYVEISKQGAIDYIIQFDGTDDFEDPNQMKLPFPDYCNED
jgi:DNA-binding transcriptional MocR family regulator